MASHMEIQRCVPNAFNVCYSTNGSETPISAVVENIRFLSKALDVRYSIDAKKKKIGKLLKNGKANEERKKSMKNGETDVKADGDVQLLCNLVGHIVMLPLEKYTEAWK